MDFISTTGSKKNTKRRTYFNSLWRKGFCSWIKPVHDCLLQCLSCCKRNTSDVVTVCDDDSEFASDKLDVSVTDDQCLLVNNSAASIINKPRKLTSKEIRCLRRNIGHISQLSDTVDMGSIPFVRVSIFDKDTYFCVDSGSAVSVIGTDLFAYIDSKQLKRFCFTLHTANKSKVKVYGKLSLTFAIGTTTFQHDFVVADVSKNFLGADFLKKFNVWLNIDEGLHIDHNSFSSELTSNIANNGRIVLSHLHAVSANSTTHYDSSTSTALNTNDSLLNPTNTKCGSDTTAGVQIHSSSINSFANDLIEESRNNDDTLHDILVAQFCDLTPYEPSLNHIYSSVADDNTAADQLLSKKEIYPKDTIANNVCINQHLRDETLHSLKSHYPSVFTGEITIQSKHDINMSIELSGSYKRPYIYTVPYCYKKAVRERLDELMEKGIIRRSSSQYMNPITVVPKKDGSVRVCGDYRALNAITRSDCFTLPRIDYIKSHIRGNVFTTLDLKDGFFQVPMHPDSVAKTAIYTEFGLYEFMRMPFGLKNAPAVFQRFIDMVFHDLRPFTHVYIDDVIVFSNTLSEHVEHLTAVIQRLAEYGLIIQERKCSFFADRIQYLGFEFDVTGYRPLPRVLPQFSNYPLPTDKKAIQKFLGAVNFYRSHIPDLAAIAAPLYDLLKKRTKFLWTTACQKSFDLLCQVLSTRITLVPFRDEGHLVLQTDASSVALGAVLLQNNLPVEFYSRRLSSVEQRYPTYEREAAAMVSAMIHFRPFLIGQHFELHTDHRPLLAWRNKMPESKRQARLWVKVQDLDYTIKYIPGEENVLADLMSRPPGEEMSSFRQLHDDVTLNGMAISLLSPELKEAQSESFIADLKISPQFLTYIDGFAYITDKGYPRLLVPPAYQESLVSSIHCLGHFGRRRTLKSVSMLYWWRGMPAYVARFVRCCESCQRNKPCKKQKRQPVKFFATARFKIVHLDFVGPFKPSSKGNNYLFTMMDRYSRWIEAIPMRDPTALTCAQVFVSSWVCRYGIPEAIITDQGGQFESQLFNEVLCKFGISRHRTTAYHPETNGILERAHGTLKNCLRCLITQVRDWEEQLPIALYAMRTAVFDSDLTAATILYGEPISVPGSFLSIDPMLFRDDMSAFMSQLAMQLNTIRSIILETQKLSNTNVQDIDASPDSNNFAYSHACQPNGEIYVVPVLVQNLVTELKKHMVDYAEPLEIHPLQDCRRRE